MLLLVIVNSLIFTFISGVHIYWAGGGKWASAAVLPTKSDGTLMLNPGLMSTLVVAGGLLIFALLTLGNLGIWDAWLSHKIIILGNWFIMGIFLLRAIGDFNYVGFFKQTKGTPFAQNDTKIYSPLCATIGAISLIINLSS